VAARSFNGRRGREMSRVIQGNHTGKTLKQKGSIVHQDMFEPCSPDMTICGDCESNRVKNKCPRLKERLQKKNT